MIIGILTIYISLDYMESIKEKRNRARSLKDRIRKKFNVSVAEVSGADSLRNQSKIVVCAVSNDREYLKKTLANVFNLAERAHADIITKYSTEFLTHENDDFNNYKDIFS